jgi:hypothetical protein
MADDRFPTWSPAAPGPGTTLTVWREGSRPVALLGSSTMAASLDGRNLVLSRPWDTQVLSSAAASERRAESR